MNSDKSCTVVIPTKNEAPTLERIINEVSLYASEVIVVDGHSKDETRDIAERLGVKCILDNGKGKGDGIRCVIPHLSKAVTVFIDADGSHDPHDIPKLVEPLFNNECDHVTGSRLIGGSSELHGGFDEFLRLTGSSFITACINKRFKVRLSDSQNGFRAIKTSVLRELGLTENLTTIEQEMIMRTLKKGFRMGEVPTHEYVREQGESNIKLSRVWHHYGFCLLKHLLF